MSLISVQFLFFTLAVLVLYYIIPSRFRWIVLLIASFVFYWFAGPGYLIYILINSACAYFAAYMMDRLAGARDGYIAEKGKELGREEKKAYKAGIKKKQKRFLLLAVLVNVGILATFKYLDIGVAYFNYFRLTLTGNVNLVPQPSLILPLGMSFYTFQSIGYVIDVYYGRVKPEKNYLRFLLFISFFPQLVQGPISRFADLQKELFAGRNLDIMGFSSGLYRICWGLFKKLIIADRLSAYVASCVSFREIYKGPYLLLCIFFYAFQIYGDFSGGIDVAVGGSQLFGIKLAENFDRPFFSKRISEYWTRWHITLGTWFRDYVFYPLSVNKSILRFGKWCRMHIGEGIGKRVPIYLPMIAVWALTGMWHGYESKYLVWGLLNCLFIILGTETEPLSLKIMERFSLREDMFFVKCYRIAKTFWLTAFLRVFDLVRHPSDGFALMRDVFRDWNGFDLNEVYTVLGLPEEELIVAIVAIALLTIVSLIQRKGRIGERLIAKNVWYAYGVLVLLSVIVLIFGSYGLGYDAQSFIYMKF